MSWLIVVLLFLVVVLASVQITLAVRRWLPVMKRRFQRVRQLHLPRRKRRRLSQIEQPADLRTLWTKIADLKAFLEPKTQGVQLTPLALMLELRALERGLNQQAVGQRVSDSNVFFYGAWLKTLEKSIRSCSWLTTEPTPQEKQVRGQTYALLNDLLKRLEALGAPAKADLVTGALALLGLQNQDAKVSAAMCRDYTRFVERKLQDLEAKYRAPISPMQPRVTPASVAEAPSEQPLVRRPLQGASVPAQTGQHLLPRAERQRQEQQRPSETPEEQPLVRRPVQHASAAVPAQSGQRPLPRSGSQGKESPVAQKILRTTSF